MGEARAGAAIPARLWTWLRGRQPSQLWRLVIIGVLAATSLFGGLDTVDRRITDVEVGKPFSDGQYTLVIERASLVREVTAGNRVVEKATPGRSYLGVIAEVRNDGTIPATVHDELDLQDHPDSAAVAVRRLADGEPVAGIGPGLTERLAFIWSVPADAIRPGDSVVLRVPHKQYRELVTSYGQAWVPSLTDYGRVVVPVEVRP